MNGLFLHMGPGFHSQVEKKKFSNNYSQVEFWDQPTELGSDNQFKDLSSKVASKIINLAESNGRKVHIIAHSFGGLLATEALKSCSDHVEKCTFIGTGFGFKETFVGVLRSLLSDGNTDGELKTDIDKFLQQVKSPLSINDYWASVSLVMRDPEFMRVYWQDQSKFKEYLTECSSFKGMDQSVFMAVATDFLNKSICAPSQSNFNGPVVIKLGDSDPLIDVTAEKLSWSKVFPQATIQVIEGAGHFLHLEKNTLFIDSE